MKLPSYLIKSRHGVYYFRIQFSTDNRRRERRITLSTKCPKVAKAKALQISAIIFKGTFSIPDMAMAFDPKNPMDLLKLLKKKDGHQQFDIELPDGRAIRNIKPDEVDSAMVAYNHMASSIESIGAIPQHVIDKMNAPSSSKVGGGATVDEVIEKYATRNNQRLKKKTQYDYRKSHEAFSAWIAQRKNNKAFPIRLITETDFSDFIDDLKAKNISDRTIQDKYLAALSGLFALAQSSGLYPKGLNPAKGHRVFTKKDLKNLKPKTGYQPFTTQELVKIFAPENLLILPKPDDYWLPLLGLFTGGRIEELCQLAINGVDQTGESLLSFTILSERYLLAQTLIKLGIDVTITDRDGESCLHRAAACPWSSGLEKTVSAILKNGFNIDLQDDNGNTALGYAASEEMASLLLRKGANLEVINIDGETPELVLEEAGYRESALIVKRHRAVLEEVSLIQVMNEVATQARPRGRI